MSDPSTTRTPGLTQGRYGNAGNLELVVPLAEAGLCVHWYNSDPEVPEDLENGENVENGTERQPIAPRRWSEGLRFGSPERHHIAAVTQLRIGPDHLAVTAIVEAGAVRYRWTPEDGFTAAEELLAGARACTALVETDGTVRALAIDGGGELVHLSAGLRRYPRLTFSTAPVAPLAATFVSLTAEPGTGRIRSVAVTANDARMLEPCGAGWIDVGAIAGRWRMVYPAGDVAVGLDLDGGVWAVRGGAAELLWRDERWTALTAAATTLDGGRIDVVLSSDANGGIDQLWHGAARGLSPLLDPRPIVPAPRH